MTTVVKMRKQVYMWWLCLAVLLVAPTGAAVGQGFSFTHQAVTDLKVLASATMAGRGTGTGGNAKARAYIIQRLKAMGVQPVGGTFEHPFTGSSNTGHALAGTNIVGTVRGSTNKTIVVTAHYDHLGQRYGYIYYGADDNASGVAALLAVAEYFTKNPPRHNILLVAFDAEEHGLVGAKQFVAQPPVPVSQMALNINLDMVSRSAKKELVACGTRHYPQLKPLVQAVAPQHSGLTVKYAHDGAPNGGQDWTTSSDHAHFHSKGIPFVYFGVEDHPDYHKPTDTFDRIDQRFYNDVVLFITHVVKHMDLHL